MAREYRPLPPPSGDTLDWIVNEFNALADTLQEMQEEIFVVQEKQQELESRIEALENT